MRNLHRKDKQSFTFATFVLVNFCLARIKIFNIHLCFPLADFTMLDARKFLRSVVITKKSFFALQCARFAVTSPRNYVI